MLEITLKSALFFLMASIGGFAYFILFKDVLQQAYLMFGGVSTAKERLHVVMFVGVIAIVLACCSVWAGGFAYAIAIHIGAYLGAYLAIDLLINTTIRDAAPRYADRANTNPV